MMVKPNLSWGRLCVEVICSLNFSWCVWWGEVGGNGERLILLHSKLHLGEV